MTDTVAPTSVRAETRHFYLYMAIACAAVAFLGFAPTYWLPVASGTFKAAPIYHLHGLLFFAWTLYFVFQTWLVGAGQTARHKTVGMIGISLATAMTVLGPTVAIISLRRDIAAGTGEVARAFLIVPLTDIAFFATMIVLALIHLRRTERHKRLMLLAAISILSAAIARWFVTFLAPPGSPPLPTVAQAAGPGLVAALLIVVAMVHDWRTRGRPHAVYVWGLAAYIGIALLRIPVSATPAWQAFAASLAGLAG